MKASRKQRRLEAAKQARKHQSQKNAADNASAKSTTVADDSTLIELPHGFIHVGLVPTSEKPTINLGNDLENAAYIRQITDECRHQGRLFVGKTAYEWAAEAAARPNPKSLWMSLWHENEMCCLFADTNVGKSIYAVQIANSIARSQRVLYFDFEMTDKQFQLRYTDEDTGEIYKFTDNLVRIEFSKENVAKLDLAGIVHMIGYEALQRRAKVVIIDNVSWICNCAESADVAGELMSLLIEMKRLLGLSILVLAHTPKRMPGMPLTQNCLAGSKRLANFMDSMFAIGMDRTNLPAGRYIKQIKVRSTEMEYDAANVITARLEKNGNFISLVHTGYGVESRLIGTAENAKISRNDLIAKMIREGAAVREICEKLKVSSKTIAKVKSEIFAA